MRSVNTIEKLFHMPAIYMGMLLLGITGGVATLLTVNSQFTLNSSITNSDWFADATQDIRQREYFASYATQTVFPEHDKLLQAPNRAQHFRSYFLPDRIALVPRTYDISDTKSNWQWSLRLSDVNADGTQIPLQSAVIANNKNRVEYQRGNLVEWYINNNKGLEQGFTLNESPLEKDINTLRLSMEVEGSLYPRLSAKRDALTFINERGVQIINFGHLVTYDADNKVLPSHFELRNHTLSIVVDTRNAVYPITIDPLATSADWIEDSPQADAEFAYAVASAGDVNGDGYSDVIIGSRLYDNGSIDEGMAFVYHGSATGLPATANWTVDINIAGAEFGTVVAGIGDVNGDGYTDVAVGGRNYSNGQATEGAVFVYHGSASGLPVTDDWFIEGNVASIELGYSIGSAGDVNGDGYSDLAISARLYSNGQASEGIAYVFHGSASGLPDGNSDGQGLTSEASWSYEPNVANARFGDSSIGTAGDVNGDGYSDLLVGARRWSNDGGTTTEGRAYLFYGSASGLSASEDWKVESDMDGSWFGRSVATAGDVNGDGYSDIVIGAGRYMNGQTDEGAVFVFHGSASGLPDAGADGLAHLSDASWSAEGNAIDTELGYWVASAGDVNGDGYADIIVGARLYDNGQTDEGGAFVYLGSSSGLSTVADWSAESDYAGAQMGRTVASAGDVNGDGFSDIIVGAPFYNQVVTNDGRAYVYYGSADGPASASSWTVDSNQGTANLGISVASAGDVNGDGYEDIAIGASTFDNGQTDEGRVFVYHGAAGGPSTTADWTAESDQASANFGVSLASAGDVNGDGYADLVVGANLYDNGESDEGRAFVYYGSGTGLSATADWTMESNQASANYGISVNSAGDVNGDGYADVIVGANLYDNGQASEGAAFIYYGATTGLSTFTDWQVESNSISAEFGISVASAGDVNGDGFDDVVIGANKFTNGQTAEGGAFVYHGSVSGVATSANWSFESNQANAELGVSVASAGDVNGDGYADLAVGANLYDSGQTDEGVVLVFHGSGTGLNTSANWTGQINQANANYGISVASAGDINGDKYSDLIVGANLYDNGQNDEGGAFVYYGSSTGLSASADASLEINQASAQFGIAVASAGDTNGDGLADVIVGANLYDNGTTDEGGAFMFISNGEGKTLTPRMKNSGDTGPVAFKGASDSRTQFRIAVNARHPYGRGDHKLEWEVKPAGTPFDGTGTSLSSTWTNSGVSGGSISEAVTGLTAGAAYHWRARLVYDLATAPEQQYSRWFSPVRNAHSEIDVRAGTQIDMSVTVSDTVDPVPLGNNFDYVIQASNAGPDTATGIIVTAVLPTKASYSTYSGAGWSCANASGTVTCRLASIASGANSTVNLTMTATTSGSDSVSVTVSARQPDTNGTNNSDSETTIMNTPPVGVNDSASTNEDTAVLTGNVLTNDTDADSDTLSVSAADATSANSGSVTNHGNGTFTYTPPANYNGSDTFNYTVSDGNGGTDTATVTITVNPVNDAPVATDDTATTNEDTGVLTGNVLANDTDIDGDGLSVSAADASSANGGSVTNHGNGTFTFTPAANYNGSDTFNYTVSDGNGGTDTGTVTVTVNPINDAPVGVNDTASTNEDTAVLTGNVLTNDTDPEGDTLSIATADTTSVSGGSVTNHGNGTFTYTPAANFNGSDSFTYTLSDGNGGTDTATVNLTVNPVNDAPVGVNDSASTNEDTAVLTGNVLSNDTDIEGDTLSVSAADATSANSGSVTNHGNGTFTYTPPANFNGTDTFNYTVSDGNGGTDTATVTITVNAVNDAPVGVNDTASTNEDSGVTTGNVLTNDTDTEGDTLSVAAADASSAQGGSVVNHGNGTFTYTPPANFNGSDSFNYTVSDGNGGTDTATVNLTVNPVNDAPVANDDTASTAEDTPVLTSTVLINDSDIDGDTLSISAADATSVQGGTVVNHGNGTFTYTPPANFSGGDSFTYTISDGNGGTDTATVNISLTGVNDAPVATADSFSVNEDIALLTGNVLANDSDVDGDTLSVASADTSSANSGSVVNNANGTFTYTPAANFNGTDTFNYTVSDGNGGSDTATVTITVNPINDAPVGTDDTYSSPEDTIFNVPNVLTNDVDVDGDTISVTSADGTSAQGGTVVNNSDGTFIYTPVLNFVGSDSFNYTISDGNGGSGSATVNLTITASNDAPVAVNDSETTAEDTPFTTANVMTNDTDSDGDTLSITGFTTTSAFGGVVSHNGDGTFNYTPTANFNGTDNFDYTVSDGNGGSDSGRVYITVTAVNDMPVANNDTLITNEDVMMVSGNVLSNDSDIDGDTLTVIGADTASVNGGFVVNHGNGSFTYTPASNFSGSDSFNYTISDGNGGTDVGTVVVTVNGTNDIPVAGNDSAATSEDTTVTINNVLLNDTDADGDVLSVYFADSLSVEGGKVVNLNNGQFTYTPPPNFTGVDSFMYLAADTSLGTDVATVTITVTPVADAPITVEDKVITDEDTPITIIDIIANDYDPDGDAITLTSVDTVSVNGGQIVDLGENAYRYLPRENFFGPDSFGYTIEDSTGLTATGTVSVTVNSIGDAPVLTMKDINGIVVMQGQSTSFNVMVTDPDQQGSYTLSASASALGIFEFKGDKVKFTGTVAGSETVDIIATDEGGLSSSKTLSVVVNAANLLDSNDDGVTDAQAMAIGIDPKASQADTDGDGIPDKYEIGDPNNPTDSDGDGIIDALEYGDAANDATRANIAISDHVSNLGSLGDLSEQIVELGLSANSQFVANNHETLGAMNKPFENIPLITEASTGVEDTAYGYPLGIYDASISTSEGTTTLTLKFPEGVDIPENAVIRYLDQNNQWQTATDAVIDRSTGEVHIPLTDAGSMDRDLKPELINSIVGVGVPGWEGKGETIKSYKWSLGGGGCSIGKSDKVDPFFPAILMMSLLHLGMRRRRRAQ
ncbi:MAG: tandem-95 repeat protein [Gammaproteobacteria bacterium]|nr:tandem-95 repeat protein [Gammaproteobacteria bacterium]